MLESANVMSTISAMESLSVSNTVRIFLLTSFTFGVRCWSLNLKYETLQIILNLIWRTWSVLRLLKQQRVSWSAPIQILDFQKLFWCRSGDLPPVQPYKSCHKVSWNRRKTINKLTTNNLLSITNWNWNWYIYLVCS